MRTLPPAAVSTDTAEHEAFHRVVADAFERHHEDHPDYADMFLVYGPSGYVVFSHARSAALGTALKRGAYANTNLSRCWNQVLRTEAPALVDFGFYPGVDEPVALLGVPLFDAQERIQGMLAGMLTSDTITRIVQQGRDLSETGEMHLVGQDLLMR